MIPMHTIILDDDGEPRPADLLEWVRWFETADRTVIQTTVGDVLISTVFLGLDHRLGAAGLPVLWETMIFGGDHDGRQTRYTSRLEALIGHATAVALVEGQPAPG